MGFNALITRHPDSKTVYICLRTSIHGASTHFIVYGPQLAIPLNIIVCFIIDRSVTQYTIS